MNLQECLYQMEEIHRTHTTWKGIWNCPLCSPKPTIYATVALVVLGVIMAIAAEVGR